MTKRNAAVLVAKNDNQVVGLIGSYKESAELAVIWRIFVSPVYRGQGIGKMLLQEIIKVVKTDNNTRKIKLWVEENQKTAVSLYKRYGFAITGNENAYFIMEKSLE